MQKNSEKHVDIALKKIQCIPK